MIQKFTNQERKKEFDQLFKNKIIPFFNEYGFQRHTKTSKRVFKDLGNELSMFIFFEYKSFGYGFYDISIVYFDAEIGDVYNDVYLAMAQIKLPNISGNNSEEMNTSVEEWMKEMQITIMPFIEKHNTHKSILDSNQFYISPAREEECRELLIRKSWL